MSESLFVSLAFLAGIVLGTIFFGGLWWTVKRGLFSKRPALWFFGSLVLRTLIALGGFYLIGRDDWKKLLACLAGFLLARIVVTRFTRAPINGRNQIAEGRSS